MKTRALIAVGIGSIVGGLAALFSFAEADFFLTRRPLPSGNQGAQQFQYAAPWDKRLFGSFFQIAQPIPDTTTDIRGVIIPHHLLAGHMAAQAFETIAQAKPSTIVLISPNHFSRGRSDVITSKRVWKTPLGNVPAANSLAQTLHVQELAEIDEDVIAEEHGIYGIVPFMAQTLPDTKILVMTLKESTPSSAIDALANQLKNILPVDTVIIASVDFSHYQTSPVANFHDELAMNVIRTFDFDRIHKMEIDSQASIRLLLRLMEARGTQKIAYEEHTNAADIVQNPEAQNITSYYSAYFTKGEPESDPAINILFFGDMMLDRNVEKRIDEHGPDYLFSKLAGTEQRFFSGMDIVSANLEGPFVSHKRPTTKSIAFGFDPELIAMLKKYNFSLFSQANNHSYDMGSEGFAESLEYLRSEGFDVYGEQYRVDDDALFIKTIAGKKVAFIGLNDTNSPVDQDVVTSLIEKAEIEADITIVNIHWGQEYQSVSNSHQQELAHAMIDAGADAIIGHHPHVVQEMEIYNNRPIFYSLGNFAFDQYFSEETQQGLGIGLVFYEDRISTYLFPLQGVQSQVSLMEYDPAQQFMESLIDRSNLGTYSISNFHTAISL